jgi:hypothetical protein
VELEVSLSWILFRCRTFYLASLAPFLRIAAAAAGNVSVRVRRLSLRKTFSLGKFGWFIFVHM